MCVWEKELQSWYQHRHILSTLLSIIRCKSKLEVNDEIVSKIYLMAVNMSGDGEFISADGIRWPWAAAAAAAAAATAAGPAATGKPAKAADKPPKWAGKMLALPTLSIFSSFVVKCYLFVFQSSSCFQIVLTICFQVCWKAHLMDWLNTHTQRDMMMNKLTCWEEWEW